jgi:hypothetical protein
VLIAPITLLKRRRDGALNNNKQSIPSRPNLISRKPSSIECCTPRVLESIASEGIVNVSHAKADGHVLALTDTGKVRTSDPYFTLKLFCQNRGGGTLIWTISPMYIHSPIEHLIVAFSLSFELLYFKVHGRCFTIVSGLFLGKWRKRPAWKG